MLYRFHFLYPKLIIPYDTRRFEQRIEKLEEKDLNIIKFLIFRYQNFNASEEKRSGYRVALHHLFHALDIASYPDLDLRPAVDQQIEKIIKAIEVIDKEK